MKCLVCNRSYADNSKHFRSEPEVHRQIWYGIKRPVASWAQGEPVHERPDLDALHVPPVAGKPAQDFVTKVTSLANRETGFDFGLYNQHTSRKPHAFIGFIEDRAAVVILVSQGWSTWAGTWEEYDAPGSQNRGLPLIVDPTRWAVAFAWTAQRRRQQGLCEAVVHHAAAKLGVTVDDLAVQWPLSASAEAALRASTPIIRLAR